MASFKDGSLPKSHVDQMGIVQDPSMIDTKADLKEQFSKLTMRR